MKSRGALRYAGSLLALAALLGGCDRPPSPPPPTPGNGGAPPPRRGYRLVLEAETGTVVAPFAVAAEPDTSGGRCVRLPVIPKDEASGNWRDPAVAQGTLTLTVAVPASGKAWLWFRTYWRGGCSNSFRLDYPGGERTVGEDGVFGTWHWVKGPAGIALEAGQQTFTLRVREDDLGIDQVLLTTDPEFVPQGMEAPGGR